MILLSATYVVCQAIPAIVNVFFVASIMSCSCLNHLFELINLTISIFPTECYWYSFPHAPVFDQYFFFIFFILFKHICNCLPQKHLGLSRGLTIIQ